MCQARDSLIPASQQLFLIVEEELVAMLGSWRPEVLTRLGPAPTSPFQRKQTFTGETKVNLGRILVFGLKETRSC